MGRPAATSGGRLGGLLLVAAGLLTLVNNYLPGSERLDVAVLTAVGLVAVAAGVVAYLLPWSRWPVYAPLALAALAFGLIAVSDRYGGVSAFSYAVYFVVLFVWVGVALPPRTSLYLAPFAAATYVLPLLVQANPPTGGVSSATVAIPVCVLVGETLARTVRRQAEAQAALAQRIALVERLATLVGELNADLDVDAVLGRIATAARELVGARAAGFVTVAGSRFTVAAVDGLPGTLVGETYDVAGSSMADLLDRREVVVVTDWAPYPDLGDRVIRHLPGLHTMLVIPSVGRGEVRGALYVFCAVPSPALTPAEIDVVTLLAGHAGAALANAATHAEVVHARDHEQSVIDGMADGMAVVGPDGRLTGWNAAAATLTGLRAADVLGGAPPIPPGAAHVPAHHRLPSGRWIEVLSSPLGSSGETVVSFRDITEAKALEDAKDLFLATTSHELRTPITVIKGYVSILRTRWADLGDPERTEALAVIARRTEALVSLVNQLLLGARAGAAKAAVHLAPFDLGQAVEAAARDLVSLSARHVVVVDVADGVPEVLGDASAVEPVIGQLVENAIKYSPRGGTVRVACSPGEGVAVVEVLDDGIGIPAGREADIFTRFYQADAGDRRQFAGIGLGLHIVRELVEAQGGTVFASNRPEGGARIGFILRYAPAVPLPRATPDASAVDAR